MIMRPVGSEFAGPKELWQPDVQSSPPSTRAPVLLGGGPPMNASTISGVLATATAIVSFQSVCFKHAECSKTTSILNFFFVKWIASYAGDGVVMVTKFDGSFFLGRRCSI